MHMIVSYYTFLVAALAWVTLLSGIWAAVYYLLLWVLPLLTAFPFFMLLRQFVQHANCDRGRFTNTRVFLVGWLLEFAVFPFGQEYHLPHHLFASVPHYRLKELHEILMCCPDYRDKVVIVNGYVARKDGYPTVIDVLGPAYAPRGLNDPYLDDSVLIDNVVAEDAEIVQPKPDGCTT
jgi:fatty acid desaturase